MTSDDIIILMTMNQSEFYLTITGPILDAQIAQLMILLDNTISSEGINHLYVAINTPGGSVNAGIVLYHYLRGLPIKVTTHNIGQVDSIGNTIFLAGEERFASPATSFLLHGVSLNVAGNSQFSRNQLGEISSQLEKDELRIETITTERSKLTKRQLQVFFDKGSSLSPGEAETHGIVTGIREFEIPNGAKKGIFNTFPSPDQGDVSNTVNSL